jgi:hypothetical protein
MKRVTFTLVYIALISIAANINKVQGNTSGQSIASLESPITQMYERTSSLPMVLASGPVTFFPEPTTISLFGFGFLMVIGFGWIKKSPDHD